MRQVRQQPSRLSELANVLKWIAVCAVVLSVVYWFNMGPEKSPQPNLVDLETQMRHDSIKSWVLIVVAVAGAAIVLCGGVATAWVLISWAMKKAKEAQYITPDKDGNLPVVPIKYTGRDEWGHKVTYRVFTDLEKAGAVTKASMNGKVDVSMQGNDEAIIQGASQRRHRAAQQRQKAKTEQRNAIMHGPSKTTGRAPTKAYYQYEAGVMDVERELKEEKLRGQRMRNQEQQRRIVERNAPKSQVTTELRIRSRLSYENAVLECKRDGAIALGQDVDTGELAAWELSRGPHLRVLGSTGSGKSVMAQSIVAQMILNKMDVIILDIERADFEWAGGHAQLIDTNDPNIFFEALSEIWALYHRRMDVIKANHSGTQAKYGNLNPDVKMNRVGILIDEFTAQMMNASDIPGVPDLLDEIAARVRKGGMHILLADQRSMADVMTGRLRNNFSRSLVGRMPADAMSAIKAKQPLKDFQFKWSEGSIIMGWDVEHVTENVPPTNSSPRHIDVSEIQEISAKVSAVDELDDITESDRRIARIILANLSKTNQDIADIAECGKRKIQLVKKDLRRLGYIDA